MKFLTNTYDPSKVEQAKMSMVLPFQDMYDPNSRERAWQRHLDYLKGKHIGRPQATVAYTVEQLEAMGMVGVYDNDEIMLSGKDAKEFLRALLDKESK